MLGRPTSAPAGRKPGTLAYRIFGAGKAKPAPAVKDSLQEAYEKHGEKYDKFQDARVAGGEQGHALKGRTALMMACDKGHEKVVRVQSLIHI